MAFAKQTNNAFLTEVDLLRQIASNQTKQELMALRESQQDQELPHIDQKEVMSRNVRQAHKVYSAFCKFVKSQCQSKNKVVDSHVIGLFEQTDIKTLFWPSPDFLDAGKFKISQSSRPHGEPMDQHEAQYQKKIEETTAQGRLVTLNWSSIALVCQTNKEMARRILQKFFAALVEVSRKTQKEARINLGFACLHLFKNREIAFETAQDLDNLQLDGPSSAYQLRNQLRDDISVIDAASAVLSRGGGTFYSVRSDQLSNLSVVTPQTQASTQSSYVSQRARSLKPLKDQLWAKYKQKNIEAAKQRTAAHQRAESFDNRSTPSQQQGSPTSSGNVPYPFLQAFIDRQTGARFTKRVVFDHSEYNDLLGQIVNQMNEKKTNDLVQKTENIEKEKEELAAWKQRIMDEQQHMQNDRILKKNQFIAANNKLRKAKQDVSDHSHQTKMSETVSYFPFTHGDSIEKQREILEELQKHELMVSYKERQQQQSIARRQKEQQRLNQMVNQELLNTANGQSNGITDQTHQPPSYEQFLRAQANKPRRQANIAHFQTAMEKALQRHENDLQKTENLKKGQISQFQEQIQLEQANEDAKKKKQVEDMNEIKKQLTDQINQKKARTLYELNEEKQPVNTSFGPEQQEVLVNGMDRRLAERIAMKIELERQIDMKHNSNNTAREIEKDQDRRDVQNATQIYEEDVAEEKQLKKDSADLYKKVWIEQKKLREAGTDIENLFK